VMLTTEKVARAAHDPDAQRKFIDEAITGLESEPDKG